MNPTMIIYFVLMIAVFYFLLIRPQQKRQKAAQAMQSSLAVGDPIVTIGGMHGVVDAIEDNKVIVKCPDGSKLTFDRFAIRDVVKSQPSAQ